MSNTIPCSACSSPVPVGQVLCPVCGQPMQLTIHAPTAAKQVIVLSPMSAPGTASAAPSTTAISQLVPIDPVGNLDRRRVITLPTDPFNRILGWIDASDPFTQYPIIDLYIPYRDWISIPNPSGGGGRAVGVSRKAIHIYRLEVGPVIVQALPTMRSKLWLMHPGETGFEVKVGDTYPIRPGTSIFVGSENVGMTFIAE